MGTWRVHSDIDPRWNNSGRAYGDAILGPTEMNDWIEKCKKEYGEVPEDGTVSFWKD